MKSLKRSTFLLSLLLAAEWCRGATPIFAAKGHKDACSLMTAIDADAVLGQAGSGYAGKGVLGAGENSSCTYRSMKDITGLHYVALSVLYATDDLRGSMSGVAEQLKSAHFNNVHDIAELGDSAVAGSAMQAGLLRTELVVLKGNSVLLRFIIVTQQNQASSLRDAKLLAMKVLSRLGN